MKEFCNFQNCGLSFTLFNKLVWALIMENGCTGREGERLSGRETFGRLLIHFPFHNICFAVFSLGTPWVIISGVFRLQKKGKSWKNRQREHVIHSMSKTHPPCLKNMASVSQSTFQELFMKSYILYPMKLMIHTEHIYINVICMGKTYRRRQNLKCRKYTAKH